ncbi:tripartite tricarboxylate transporter TctB family protein [Siccirubricoccus sp. KC 17139]|uniref:Tripartite tricarboxylate transporter TctB family protein n=1 Tax=Siccirubricoccus soli TaxID=2899147 RepID=A0ABT1DBM4_9PROT|nr:tripartite tricarboxylate transporter TctB family protein [Siccirubricoccus soli]MCP2685480.1 tripartite tricarboxylate transporter TctB family protein [Siccirubricoccus soli]
MSGPAPRLLHAAPAPRPAVLPDLWVGLFVIALGGLALWQAAVIPTSPIYAQVGPKAVPYVVAAGLLLLGAGLTYVALRGGWSYALEEMAEAPPTNWRAITLMLAGLLANLVLIGPCGFSIAASAQFVLVAAAFGSRRLLRDLVLAVVLTLLVWFGFVEGLGVNIGAGYLERLVLMALGQEIS